MTPHNPSWNPAELAPHAPWIRSLALRLVRDGAEADDLVQETMLAALEKRPAMDRNLRPWLRSVLNRRWAFGARSSAHRNDRERGHAAEELQSSGSDLAQRAEEHARLVQALARLREPFRATLLLRYYEGLTPKEIAQKLELPGATVRSHLKRGLTELRERLDGEHGGDRRAWCMALVPLAIDAPDVLAFTNPFLSSLNSLNAMHLLLPLAAAVGSLLFFIPPSSKEVSAVPPPVAILVPEHSLATATSPMRGSNAIAKGPGRTSMFMSLSTEDGPLVGFVRERGTEKPIRGYAIGFKPEGEEGDFDILYTDEAGRFESEVDYTPGTTLGFILMEHPEVLTVVRTSRQVMPRKASVGSYRTWDPAEGPFDFHATVGPEFDLELNAPFEVDVNQLVATLQASQDAPWGPLEISYQFRAPVRSGELFWTRFASVYDYHMPAGHPWLLRLETLDGLWVAKAEMEDPLAEHPQAFELNFQPAARLDVNVLTAEKRSDLYVVAENLSDGTRQLLMPTGEDTLADGQHSSSLQLMSVAPGAYRITVNAEGMPGQATDVTLVAGTVHELPFVLGVSDGQSHIRGELRSLSGEYKGVRRMMLLGPVGGTYSMHPVVWEEHDGVWVASFAFDNLPPKTYSLQLSSMMDRYRWDGLAAQLTPPLDGLVFTCRDTEPVRSVLLQMTDATTGEVLSSGFATLDTGPGYTSPGGSSGSALGVHFRRVPTDATFTWWAHADGYIPLFGDESALVLDGDVGRISAVMQPGWGARVLVRVAKTPDPVPGVALFIDGVQVGVTDAMGQCDLTASSAPVHFDLSLDGWEIAGGTYDTVTHNLTGFGSMQYITMKAVE